MARGDDHVRIKLQRDIAPTGMRMPDGLRDQLKAVAAINKRSMNSEIVSRLEASFEREAGILNGDIAALIERHVQQEVTRRLQKIASQIGGA